MGLERPGAAWVAHQKTLAGRRFQGSAANAREGFERPRSRVVQADRGDVGGQPVPIARPNSTGPAQPIVEWRRFEAQKRSMRSTTSALAWSRLRRTLRATRSASAGSHHRVVLDVAGPARGADDPMGRWNRSLAHRPSATPSARRKRASNRRSAASATASTTRPPRWWSACPRPRWSGAAAPGAAWRPSSSPPSDGWTGPTPASSGRSATPRPPRPRSATAPRWRNPPPRRGSHQAASSEAGAVRPRLAQGGGRPGGLAPARPRKRGHRPHDPGRDCRASAPGPEGGVDPAPGRSRHPPRRAKGPAGGARRRRRGRRARGRLARRARQAQARAPTRRGEPGA